jgi:hypothetical protein
VPTFIQVELRAMQHAHLHAFYAERGEPENHESSALTGHPVMAKGYGAFRAALGRDAVRVERPTLADAGRHDAAQRATADQRADFETSVAANGLPHFTTRPPQPYHR